MWQDILLRLAKALLYVFANPMIYIGVLLVILMGYFRIKRERKQFHKKVRPELFELKMLFQGVIFGFMVSFVTVASGIAIPFDFLFILMGVTLVLVICFQSKALSPAYFFGISIMIAVLLVKQTASGTIFSSKLDTDYEYFYLSMAVLMGLLLFVEGHLIWWHGHQNTSPAIGSSNRGGKIGMKVMNRVWLVPVLVMIPVDDVPKILEPALFSAWNHSSWIPVFIPFLIGFGIKAKARYTVELSKRVGGSIFVLAVIVTTLALAGLFDSRFIIASIVLAIIGRFAIQFVHIVQEKKYNPIFSRMKEGIRVLDVFPESPAAKLGIATGTIIQTVNGEPVSTKKELYRAIQKNSTFCKMTIIDMNQELKEIQTPIYQHDHHELGIIVPE